MLVVRSAGDEHVFPSLRAELISYRFRVVEIDTRAGRHGQALSALALARHAQAALRVQADKGAVEVWVEINGPSGERGNEELVSGPGLQPEVLAVRVTEAMRARGLRLEAPPSAASGPTTASTSRAAPIEATSPTSEAAAAAETSTVTEPAEATEQGARESASTSTSDATHKPAPSNARPPQPTAAAPTATTGAASTKTGAVAAAQRKPSAQPTKPNTSAPTKPPTSAKPAPTLATSPTQPTKLAPTPTRPATSTANETPHTEPSPQPSAATKDEPNSREAHISKPLIYAELSAAGVFSPSPPGLGPGFDLWVAARAQPYRTSSVSVFALVPLLQKPIDAPGEGQANVRILAVGGSADLHVPVQPLELSVGLGAAALFTSVNAEPAPGTDATMLKTRSAPQRTGVVFVRAGVFVQLAPELRAAARVMVGMGVPELQIKFDDHLVANAGRPLVIASLGLELALPWQR